MLEGFKKFILRGNVVDLAVGVVIGAAFSSVISAFTKDLLTPFISAVFKIPDFSGLNFILRGNKFQYGDFFNNLISFIISAAVVYFFVVLPINKLMLLNRKETKPDKKKCPHCLSEIPINAKKCAYCTSNL